MLLKESFNTLQKYFNPAAQAAQGEGQAVTHNRKPLGEMRRSPLKRREVYPVFWSDFKKIDSSRHLKLQCGMSSRRRPGQRQKYY